MSTYLNAEAFNKSISSICESIGFGPVEEVIEEMDLGLMSPKYLIVFKNGCKKVISPNTYGTVNQIDVMKAVRENLEELLLRELPYMDRKMRQLHKG